MRLPYLVAAGACFGVLSLPGQGLPDASSARAAAVPLPLERLRVPIHDGEPDPVLGPYGTWAAGHGYKASFHGDATFVPYLGTDEPTNMPVQWRTSSVRAGGRELLVAGTMPERWHDRYRYEYRHGGGIVEAYDVRADGLEQSFVLATRPAPGDLVITGAVTSPLHPRAAADGSGALAFVDARGRELVRYGKAVAIDASGERIEIATGCTADTVTLEVPDAWLARATFPVTIDPLLTRAQLSVSSNAYSLSDIVRDDANDDVLVVYTLAASSGDTDPYAVLSHDDFDNSTVVFADINTSWASPEVACAASGPGQDYCVAFVRRASTSKVWFHIVQGGDFNYSFTVHAANGASTGRHELRPVVGGSSWQASSGFMLAYQTEASGSSYGATPTSGLAARPISLNGTVGNEINIITGMTASFDRERPSINKTSSTDSWVVAWQELDNNATTSVWRPRARGVFAAGTVSVQVWTLPGVADSLHRSGPKIAGDDGRYLLAYSRRADPTISASLQGFELLTVRIDWPALAPTTGPESLLAQSPTRDLYVGDVAYDTNSRSHWCVQGVSDRTLGGSGNVTFYRTGYRGLELERAIAHTAPTATANGLRGGMHFDDDHDRFLGCWSMNDASGTSGVFARGYEYAAGQIVRSGVGCSSATIGWIGRPQIGSQFTGFSLDAAPPQRAAVLFISLGATQIDLSPYGLSGCQLLVDVSGWYINVGTSTDATGHASITMPLLESLLPGAIYGQFLHLAPGANPAGILATKRLLVQLVR